MEMLSPNVTFCRSVDVLFLPPPRWFEGHFLFFLGKTSGGLLVKMTSKTQCSPGEISFTRSHSEARRPDVLQASPWQPLSRTSTQQGGHFRAHPPAVIRIITADVKEVGAQLLRSDQLL